MFQKILFSILLVFALHPLSAQQQPFNVKDAVKKALPAVVKVDVVETLKQKAPSGSESSPFFDFFFDNPEQQGEREFKNESLGSGVLVKKVATKYYVLTNAHVVAGAETIRITMDDGREYNSTLVGQEPKRDLALLVFETKENLPVIALGNSDALEVGDWVIAIGSPYGFQSTVTLGIVSALKRKGGPGDTITEFIQTDAAINKGNSGGALVNLRGELVGINTWISSQSGGSIGLGFAVPSRQTTKVINDLMQFGQIKTPWLGISMFTLDRIVSESLFGTVSKGALVSGVYQSGPAGKGGLVPGDVITRIDKEPIESSDDIILAISNKNIGEKVSLTFNRKGVSKVSSFILEERKPDPILAGDNVSIWPGFAVYPVGEEVRKELSLGSDATGNLVRQVISGTLADKTGLLFGDIITEINGKKQMSMKDFFDIVGTEGPLKLVVLRSGKVIDIEINSR